MRIAFIHHGPTEWNEEGRIQGRIDMPLSAAGRAKMAGLLPPWDSKPRAFVSRFARRQTAELLGLAQPIDARREHDWGSRKD